jgi:phosphoglycolate phosphatase
VSRFLLLFDCDGTLVDSQHDIVTAMNFAFSNQGLQPPSRAATLAIVRRRS